MRLLLLFALLFGCATGRAKPTGAQEAPVDAPRPLVVMNTAAHPDDEDGATLTYYRYAKDAVAYSVIFTRGEGGQNEIGPELYQALGAIRTEESEAAARHLGTQLFFLNFDDFGYSKHADEAFAAWGGRDEVTARLVYLVRKLKPDVLFTNHDTVTVGPRRQHGHHQAVGLATYDAFHLAADPSYHPGQLEEPGVDLWQPSRLYLRRWNAEGTEVAVPVGATDPHTGAPYAARAGAALREHASQGMERWADRVSGQAATHFTLLRSTEAASPDSSDLAAGLAPNEVAVPSVAYLVDAGRVAPLPQGAYTVSDTLVVPGEALTLTWSPSTLPRARLRWHFFGAVDTTLHLREDSPARATLRLPVEAVPTRPRSVYQYRRLRSRPTVGYAVRDAASDSLLAAGYLPVEIAPPLHVAVGAPVLRLHAGKNAVPIESTVYDPAVQSVTYTLAVAHAATRRVIAQQTVTRTTPPGYVYDTLAVALPDSLAEGAYHITLAALPAAATLPPSPATASAQGSVFEVHTAPGLRVGVVTSYDDALPQALDELGVAYTLLDADDLARAAFDGLHTIVVDIRAYLVRPDLRAHNDRLLDWVRDGGHLIVNYQKTLEWNADYADPFEADRTNPGTFAPYPLVLGRDRVTREDAAVAVQVPTHPLFNTPNPIDEAAWDGWVQERGLYFPADYDAAYTELLCMSDPGEAPLCSSTLLADYGEGTYLYTALGWYRQLKQYHPGAFALFANMLSLPLVEDANAPLGAR